MGGNCSTCKSQYQDEFTKKYRKRIRHIRNQDQFSNTVVRSILPVQSPHKFDLNKALGHMLPNEIECDIDFVIDSFNVKKPSEREIVEQREKLNNYLSDLRYMEINLENRKQGLKKSQQYGVIGFKNFFIKSQPDQKWNKVIIELNRAEILNKKMLKYKSILMRIEIPSQAAPDYTNQYTSRVIRNDTGDTYQNQTFVLLINDNIKPQDKKFSISILEVSGTSPSKHKYKEIGSRYTFNLEQLQEGRTHEKDCSFISDSEKSSEAILLRTQFSKQTSFDIDESMSETSHFITAKLRLRMQYLKNEQETIRDLLDLIQERYDDVNSALESLNQLSNLSIDQSVDWQYESAQKGVLRSNQQDLDTLNQSRDLIAAPTAPTTLDRDSGLKKNQKQFFSQEDLMQYQNTTPNVTPLRKIKKKKYAQAIVSHSRAESQDAGFYLAQYQLSNQK